MSDTTVNVNALEDNKTKKIVLAALFAALTCVSTMIIKVPTPTLGYIHPGDGFVLLAPLILGPLWGSFAAGIGSALSDLIGGYFVFVPATFIIKALTALVCYLAFKTLTKVIKSENPILSLVISGIVGETVMVLCYFIFEIFMLSVVNKTSMAAGVVAAAAGIVPNIVQALFGIIILSLLYPVLKRLVRE